MSKHTYSEEFMRSCFLKCYCSKKRDLHTEVPVFCRSVDLVVLDKEQETITAVEFKINDWKRAVSQVLQVAFCFDYLSICVPKPATEKGQKAIEKVCTEMGIGVFFFEYGENIFMSVVEPKSVSGIWEVQKNNVLQYLEGTLYG